MIIDTILILTHRQNGKVLLPHLDWLKKNNPEVKVEIIIGEESPHGKRYSWKNGDIPLRNWWKENGNLISGKCFGVIEWDTLITCKLPTLPENYNLVGKWFLLENPELRGKWKKKQMLDPTWHQDHWYWWDEIPKLELKEGQLAAGLVSFGFLIMDRMVLDTFSNARWDYLYEKSIQNELRFPTIAYNEGFKLGTIDLPYVTFEERTFEGREGIYHAIKNPITMGDII